MNSKTAEQVDILKNEIKRLAEENENTKNEFLRIWTFVDTINDHNNRIGQIERFQIATRKKVADEFKAAEQVLKLKETERRASKLRVIPFHGIKEGQTTSEFNNSAFKKTVLSAQGHGKRDVHSLSDRSGSAARSVSDTTQSALPTNVN